MENTKIKQDIYFYFCVGLTVYIASSVLNVIHLYQWKGREWVDFSFHLVLLSVNISLIAQVKSLSDAARKIIIIKFFILLGVFYPQIIFAKSGGWVYSGHWPHGVFQRVANLSLFVYEIFLVIYLRKRNVRFLFKHQEKT